MSSEINISLPIALLEKLRCYICKGYLSCSPVRLLPNGNCICGCCSPLITDAPIHRLVAFEPLLSKLSFPCIFKKHGCIEVIPFGKSADHESKCPHKAFACPASNFVSCTWKGMVPQFLEHFNDKHLEFLKEKAEFKLDINENAKGILMVVDNSFAFIIKYLYNTNDGDLKYDIRFCAVKIGHDASFKIQLVNDLDAECNTNLKTSECCLYDESFVDMQYAKVLNLNKCLENLDNPKCIVVAMKLKVVKFGNSNDVTQNDCGVNLDLIESLRCYVCQNYLFPPLFDFDGNVICCDCAKKNSNCKPSNNTDLLKLVNEAMYPCCWRGCEYACKSITIKDHERSCEFRLYRCVYTDCDGNFLLNLAVNHLQGHNGPPVCVYGDIVYKTSFAHNYEGKDIISIKNKRLILIEHEMINSCSPYTHRVSAFRSAEDVANVSGIVVFEHEHCKLKSKEFIVNLIEDLDVTIKELPHCFKEKEELTVTIKLNV